MRIAPRLHLIAAASLCVAAVLAPAARAQPVPVTGEDYVVAAAGSDNFEIMSAHVALTEARSPAVRAFATEMLREHGAAKAALAMAAAQASVAPPSDAIGAEDASFLAALQGANPSDFDKLYLRDQRLAHLSALQTETAYAQSGSNPALRQAAAADLPMIKRHLHAIDTLIGD